MDTSRCPQDPPNNAKIPDDWTLLFDVIKEAQSQRQVVGEFFDGLLDTEAIRIAKLEAVQVFRRMAWRSGRYPGRHCIYQTISLRSPNCTLTTVFVGDLSHCIS